MTFSTRIIDAILCSTAYTCCSKATATASDTFRKSSLKSHLFLQLVMIDSLKDVMTMLARHYVTSSWHDFSKANEESSLLTVFVAMELHAFNQIKIAHSNARNRNKALQGEHERHILRSVNDFDTCMHILLLFHSGMIDEGKKKFAYSRYFRPYSTFDNFPCKYSKCPNFNNYQSSRERLSVKPAAKSGLLKGRERTSYVKFHFLHFFIWLTREERGDNTTGLSYDHLQTLWDFHLLRSNNGWSITV